MILFKEFMNKHYVAVMTILYLITMNIFMNAMYYVGNTNINPLTLNFAYLLIVYFGYEYDNNRLTEGEFVLVSIIVACLYVIVQ